MNSTQTAAEASSLIRAVWEGDHGDEMFAHPYVDIDQLRAEPVRHRYVHGGFMGTDTRFSFYFPTAEQYGGRFFQHVTPVPQSENLAQQNHGEYNPVTFAVASGAYFVETNGGGPDAANPFSGMDQTVGAYRASAAAARFSRAVAAELFGPHRTYGYLYGGSGGAYRTIGSSENTEGVWDGFAPYVPGSPMAIPNVFAVRMHAQRILRDKFPAIVDAYDVGGDPDSLDLTDEERAALDEVTRMGFPPRSWFGWKTMGMHAFSVLYPGIIAADPTYIDDFWSVDGYLGADPTASIHRDRVQLDTIVAELVSDDSVRGGDLVAGGVDESFMHSAGGGTHVAKVRLADVPAGWMLGAQLFVRSGAASGAVIRLASVEGDIATIEPGQDDSVARLCVGDEVALDNSSFLAAQTYHRHQVPGPEYTAWDQFRADDGNPLAPQRQMLLGPMFTQHAAGTVPTGAISGKMIVLSCLLDREAFPWQADWYRARVAERLGAETDDRIRLWYVDNALHADDDPQEFPDRSVAYLGALETALRQLAAWVEQGIDPAPTTAYEVIDGQVVVAPTAAERGGVQPVVTLTVNGATSAFARVGEPTLLRISAEAPGDGVVVEIRSATGGVLGEPIFIDPAASVVVDQKIVFDAPGTHFVAVRVSAQTAGDGNDAHARAQNVGRARITVT